MHGKPADSHDSVCAQIRVASIAAHGFLIMGEEISVI